MKLVNDLLRPVFDLLQSPLAGLPAFVGILVWSIPVGIFALWVFGKTSNQDRIAEVKRHIHAGLFEIRLFNDDIRAIMRAQGEILRHVVHYQALALKPMIFILPPLVLIMVQLHQFYGFRGFRPGDEVLLTVQLDPQSVASGRRPHATLEPPPGLHASMDPVWVPSLAQISWRLEVDDWGDYELLVDIDGTRYDKTIRATERIVRLSPERPPPTFIDQLEWPSERPFDRGGAIRSMTLGYAEGTVAFLGWSFDWAFAWMVVFFVLTLVVALVLRKPMGVEL